VGNVVMMSYSGFLWFRLTAEVVGSDMLGCSLYIIHYVGYKLCLRCCRGYIPALDHNNYAQLVPSIHILLVLTPNVGQE
jgi:hypothetical protein